MFTWRTSARQAENGNRDIEKIAGCRSSQARFPVRMRG
jgi:hypothetical protein